MMNHCIAKIVEIVERGQDDRRSILQLGYNLGRLGEITGLGREPFWDRWKEPVENWDLPRMRTLVQDLQDLSTIPTSTQITLQETRPDGIGRG